MPYPVGSAGGMAAVTGQTPAMAGLGGLDGEAFLRLLVAQMRFQNPMEPTDPSAMMQQTAQFTQVELAQQLSNLQQQVLRMQQASMASGLVGKTVTAVGPDGASISGTVESVRFTATGPTLQIGGREVPLDATTEITDPVPTT